MKAVLISIRPEWCDRIATGEKTIEIRKNKPNIEPPFKCYIYETKAINRKKLIVDLDGELPTIYARGRGKVIGEFICDCIEYMDLDSVGVGFWKNDNFNYIADLGWNTGLTLGEFINYTEGKRVYGWHISDLVIYDKPKELSEFVKPGFVKYNEMDPEELCTYCTDTVYGEKAYYVSPNGPVMCEGAYCDRAYQAYLDDEGFTLYRPPQSWRYVEEVSE